MAGQAPHPGLLTVLQMVSTIRTAGQLQNNSHSQEHAQPVHEAPAWLWRRRVPLATPELGRCLSFFPDLC